MSSELSIYESVYRTKITCRLIVGRWIEEADEDADNEAEEEKTLVMNFIPKLFAKLECIGIQ